MSAYGHKADIPITLNDVRFPGVKRTSNSTARRLLNIIPRGDFQTRRQFNVGWQPADITAWPFGPFPACERFLA
jgi:hypothetical protein